MRRFFLALGVGVKDVAGPLPDVPEPAERAPEGIVRGERADAPLHLLLKQRRGPVGVRVPVLLGRLPHQGAERPLQHVGQEARAPAPGVVGEGLRGMVLLERRGPVVNTLPGYTEHLSHFGHGSTSVEFQDGQCPAVRARLNGRSELFQETTALPVLQFEPAHLGPQCERPGVRRANTVSKDFCGPA